MALMALPGPAPTRNTARSVLVGSATRPLWSVLARALLSFLASVPPSQLGLLI